MHPAGPLDVSDRSGDIAAGGNHNAAVGENWKNCFQINPFAFAGCFGADAVDHAEGDLGAGGNQKVVRRFGVGGLRRRVLRLCGILGRRISGRICSCATSESAAVIARHAKRKCIQLTP